MIQFFSMNKLIIAILFFNSISLYGQDVKKGTFKVKKPVEETVLIPKIANRSRGAITIEELINSEGIIVNDSNKVVAFDMLINVAGVQIARGAEGSQITVEMKKYISKTRKGQRIYFRNIRCIGPDGMIRKLPSMTFTIVSLFDE